MLSLCAELACRRAKLVLVPAQQQSSALTTVVLHRKDNRPAEIRFEPVLNFVCLKANEIDPYPFVYFGSLRLAILIPLMGYVVSFERESLGASVFYTPDSIVDSSCTIDHHEFLSGAKQNSVIHTFESPLL